MRRELKKTRSASCKKECVCLAGVDSPEDSCLQLTPKDSLPIKEVLVDSDSIIFPHFSICDFRFDENTS